MIFSLFKITQAIHFYYRKIRKHDIKKKEPHTPFRDNHC